MTLPLIPLLSLISTALNQAGTPLTVEDAFRIAVANSPRLRAARFESQASQAQTDRERPASAPTLSTAAEGRLQGPRVTFPRQGSGDDTVVPERFGRLELNVDQLLYHAGAKPARERYDAQTKATSLDYKRQVSDLRLEVALGYYQLQTAEAIATVAKAGADLANKHLAQTKLMLDAGTASERDVRASEADVAEADAGAVKADSGIVLARANLNRLLGREPAAPLATVSITTSPPSGTDSLTETEIVRAISRRPEIQLLEESLRAARAGASLAGTQNLPSLSGRATAAAQTPTALTSSRYFAAGLIVTWNPFDSARTRADVREARAKEQQILAQMEDARLGIRVEIQKAVQDMKDARARIEAADRQVASSQAALDISELRFQARSAAQLEVSGATLSLIRARGNREQARFDLITAFAELMHALGQDTQ